MDNQQGNGSNGKNEIFLIDGSSLEICNSHFIPAWTNYKDSSFPNGIAENMRYARSFFKFAQNERIVTIGEVVRERLRLEEIIKVHIGGCKRTLKDMNGKIRRTKGRTHENTAYIIKSGEMFISDLERYGKSIKRMVNSLKRNIFDVEKMDETQREIYDIALYEANLEHKTTGDKFGDELKTDIKLIATASTLALKSPVVVVSRDMSLLRSLRLVLKTVLGDDNSISPYSVKSYISPSRSNGQFYYPNVAVRLHNPNNF